MQNLIANGRVVDLILLFVILEAVALLGYRRITGRGLRLFDIVVLLLPGVCLLFALRAALVGAAPVTVLTWLLLSLLAHLLDLWRRQQHP
jgi:hypothetical protein